MSLIATWFSEGRRAQHPPVPRYPLRICRWRVLGRQYGAACVARPARRYPGRPDRHPRHLQGRPADAVARQFCAAGRNLRRTGCHVRAAAQQLNTTSEMWGTSRSICRTPFSTQRSTDGLLRLSTAVGWNEQNRHPGDERFANVSRAPSAVHGRKVCEAKELIRKVAAPGSGRQVAGEAI